ncbi:hypothetical protein HELRODRAFT_187411 [Helobdella robusta]|uniref:AB hydrolase-1 domain-containing protein n=1 Tax=Helobdella robusta TaxID=6412 RepID=T1FP97_HELRO|nr:hypothetical protein HELRODRAFT_187411 [Helobdella robusta]ESN95288.1 hypothetical protein HELRODRAFT_187411 [Helobdella robusta]
MSSSDSFIDKQMLHSPRDQSAYSMEHHVIRCPIIGEINVYIQGNRAVSNEVVIMTMHDLGCDYNMYQDFIDHPRMVPIRDRTVWLHLEVPGQSFNAADLPTDYQFPSMQVIAEDLITVLNVLNIKEVVCFGEGAGANILARFAMANIGRVLGVCLLHTTGTAAGLFESIKDKVMKWKFDTAGMNASAEQYLVLHRFGGFSKARDNEELKTIVEQYQEILRNKINPKNLKQFVCAFLKRTNIADNAKALSRCPVLLITGQHSIFNATTRALHQAILKTCEDKTKVEFIEVAGVANVLEERPDKLAECFQYFLQGLGLVSSIPMHNVRRMLRNRTMSMEDYDRPKRDSFNSRGSSFDQDGQFTPPPIADQRRGVLSETMRVGSVSPPGSPAIIAGHPIGPLVEEN